MFIFPACTIVSGIADQLAQIHNETFLAASLRLCEMLPFAVKEYCITVIKTLEPLLISPWVTNFTDMNTFIVEVWRFMFTVSPCFTKFHNVKFFFIQTFVIKHIPSTWLIVWLWTHQKYSNKTEHLLMKFQTKLQHHPILKLGKYMSKFVLCSALLCTLWKI